MTGLEERPAVRTDELVALATGFVAGDQDCFAEVFRRWSPLVHAVALRATRDAGAAEDITQQVFVAAWRTRASYRAETASLPTWLLGITRHRLADHHRGRGREQRLAARLVAEAAASGPRSAVELPGGDVVDRLVLAAEIDALAPPRGAIMRLAFWEGCSHAQIATRLDLPLGTVKSYVRRTLVHLRGRLEEVASWT